MSNIYEKWHMYKIQYYWNKRSGLYWI